MSHFVGRVKDFVLRSYKLLAIRILYDMDFRYRVVRFCNMFGNNLDIPNSFVKK